MSKRNSTQPMTLTQKLLGKWAGFCVRRPQAVLTLCVLFSLAGWLASYILWFPYSSPVSRLPKNFDERYAWEEASRQIQFNSEIMLRVSIPESGDSSTGAQNNAIQGLSQNAEQRLTAAVEQLKYKLSGSKKHFSDVLSSRDLQIRQTRELYELPDDDLRMLYAELLDARQVLGGRWSLLESANYADWLTSRLQQAREDMERIAPQAGAERVSTSVPDPHATLLQNRRLLESAARFAEGLGQTLAQTVPTQNSELVSPWQLNPDMLFSRADARTAGGADSDATSPGEKTVIIWAKLAEPQLANLLDRRVIGKTKKIDRQLIKKLKASMTELDRIVEDARQKFDDVAIEPFGVPVDVHRCQTQALPIRTTGLLFVFGILTLFFIAGIGHIRVYLAILAATVCSFGTYLGFCALWFEMITPYAIFIGVSVPLFAVCAGVLQGTAFVNARHRGLSVPEAVVKTMQTSGRSVLRGGLVSVAVFLAGVFYLWFYPVEHTAATLSFRSSLVGVNLAMFLLAQAVLSCLVGQLAIFPAVLHIAESKSGETLCRRPKSDGAGGAISLIRTVPSIPVSVNVLLTFVLFGGFLYCVSRQNTPTMHGNGHFITPSEKQAAALPILIPQPGFSRCEFDDIPGLIVCDASRLVASNDADRAIMIDNMSRVASHTSEQQKIPLPNQQTLQNSLTVLYRQLAGQFSGMRRFAASEKSKPGALQNDLRLCQLAGERLADTCRLLPNLSQAEYFERIDAWQQFVASDLVVQQKRLQNRLYHNSRPGTEATTAVTKRFLDADRQSLIWIFPVQNWQAVASRERPQPVIDLFLSQAGRLKVEPGQTLPAQGGFPLLVLSGHHLTRQQLPVTAAVLLITLILLIAITHRSMPTAAMTVLILIGAVSIYGLTLTTLNFAFDNLVLLPVAFFPLVLPLFLDLFRRKNMSSDHFEVRLGGILVCFGVGIVVVGLLLFSGDVSLVTAGRAMIIGWVAFMLALCLNVISVLKPDIAEQELTVSESDLRHTQYSETPAERIVDPPQESNDAEAPVVKPMTQNMLNDLTYCAIPASRKTSTRETTCRKTSRFETAEEIDQPETQEQPASLATRDQLDYYRARIEATRVFDKPSPHDVEPVELAEAVPNPESTAQVTPSPEVSETPIFPPVWSVGTKRRRAQKFVVEPPDDGSSHHGKVVSRATPEARTLARKAKKTVLTAKTPHHGSITGDTESPTILPMRRHAETAGQSNETVESRQNRERRKLG